MVNPAVFQTHPSEGFPWAMIAKLGAPDECVSFFQEVPVSNSKTKGEYKDGVPWLIFPENTFVTARYVANLKPTSHAKVPRQVNRRYISIYCLCNVLGVVSCE